MSKNHTSYRRKICSRGSILVVLAMCSAFQAAQASGKESKGPDGIKERDRQENNIRSTYSSPIALSSDNRLLWSVNPDMDTVTVIRTDTQRVIKKIKVGDEPRSIAIAPSGKYVYVANSASNSVSVIKVRNMDPDRFEAYLDHGVGRKGQLVTGAEPRSVVVTPDGERIFVANRSQDTITVISGRNNGVLGVFDIRGSECNVGDKERHYQPGALAVTKDSKTLFTPRFISYTSEFGVQREDWGKEGIVCRLSIDRSRSNTAGLHSPQAIHMVSQDTGFVDVNFKMTYAYPNQLQNIVVRGGRAYLPNIAASPSGPVNFQTNTQAFVNSIADVAGYPYDAGAINLHLGGRVPEPGRQEMYFANPTAIGFTTESGSGYAYVASGGSDVLVKLKVRDDGELDFTFDQQTTRYIDLNDPDEPSTNGGNAGKNPIGLVVNAKGDTAYVLNYVSRNISVVDLTSDRVVNVIPTEEMPVSGSREEVILVGAEMFFSTRGNFIRPAGANGSSRNRLSVNGRQNCASCHADGLTDGVIWQFQSGPRKTLAINGTFAPHDKSDQRIINASAIFDEVEDVEFNTRLTSSAGPLPMPLPCVVTPPFYDITESRNDPAHGLILGEADDFEFAPCVMTPFTVPNAGRPQAVVMLPGSATKINSLDALVEWQKYAVRTPNRPMTSAELMARVGNPTGGIDENDISIGRQLFSEAGCANCHSGGKWSSSRKDFVSPPDMAEIATEAGAVGANPGQFLYRFLKDIGSFNLNVPGSGNSIAGYPAIGGIEKDTNGLDALGFDHNGDGKGTGYNVASILGAYNIPPYYHNGACETLRCVVSDKNHRQAGLNGGVDMLSSEGTLSAITKFLESIDVSMETFR